LHESWGGAVSRGDARQAHRPSHRWMQRLSLAFFTYGVSIAPTAGGQQTTTGVELNLNLPAFRLDVFEDGVHTRSYRVAVGMPKYRTPRGDFHVTSIEWNPWWIPPDREWAKNERTTPPGWSNPMGRVKLNFLPLYFMHGTPLETSLGHAESHGCVRLSNQDALALALLLHRAATPELDSTWIDTLVANTSRSERVDLMHPVPLRIRYVLAEIVNDTLLLHRDIYALDGRSEFQRALEALRSSGIAADLIDETRLRTSLRSTTRRPARIPVASLRSREPLPLSLNDAQPFTTPIGRHRATRRSGPHAPPLRHRGRRDGAFSGVTSRRK